MRLRKIAVRWTVAAYCAASLVLLVPLAVNGWLQTTYIELLAKLAAKLRPPEFVFMGDSIVTGGSPWGWKLRSNPLAAIDLAVPGWTTKQVARNLPHALAYRPETLVIMVGVNDAILGTPDAEVEAEWRAIFRTMETTGTRLIVTLPLLTNRPALNERILHFSGVIRREMPATARVVDINPTIAPQGTLLPQFATDGVHLSQEAYAIWARSLR